MFIKCPKCRQMFDPARQMARCSTTGHDPCMPVPEYENISLVGGEEKPRQKPGSQSDFRLIWNEDK